MWSYNSLVLKKKKEEAKKSVIDLNFLKILDMKIPRHPASYKSKI